MAAKPLKIKLGTHQPNGYLRTVSEPYAVREKFVRFYVDCVCDCGNLTRVTSSKFIYEDTKSCGCWRVKQCSKMSKARLNGPNHKRQASRYRIDLIIEQNGICAWPWCKQPLGDRPSVDHDHRCCDDGALCCAYCPRGLVHQGCNSDISVLEKYRDRLDLPEEITAYLDTRRQKPLTVFTC